MWKWNNAPAAVGRRHAKEAVAVVLGHDLVRLDRGDDDAGRGHGGGEGDGEGEEGLHFFGVCLVWVLW